MSDCYFVVKSGSSYIVKTQVFNFAIFCRRITLKNASNQTVRYKGVTQLPKTQESDHLIPESVKIRNKT